MDFSEFIPAACSLIGVFAGTWFSGHLSQKQEYIKKRHEVYAAASLDIERLRLHRELIFSAEYEGILDAHYALIKLYATKESEENFRKLGLFVHRYLAEYTKFFEENNPRVKAAFYDDGDPTYEADELTETFELKLKQYRTEKIPSIDEINMYTKAIQESMRKDLGSGNR